MSPGGAVAGYMNSAVLFRFLCGKSGEVAGNGIVCALSAAHEVERDRSKLERCAALQKQDLVAVGHVQSFFKLALCFRKNFAEQ